MSSVFKMPTTCTMVSSYVKRGEYELLKQIDFSVYSKENINIWLSLAKNQLYSTTNDKTCIDYIEGVYENLEKCIEILEKAFKTDYVWETPTVSVYAYCVPVETRYRQIHYHKIFDKKTNTYSAIYCSKLVKIADKLGLNNIHLTGEASPDYEDDYYANDE